MNIDPRRLLAGDLYSKEEKAVFEGEGFALLVYNNLPGDLIQSDAKTNDVAECERRGITLTTRIDYQAKRITRKAELAL